LTRPLLTLEEANRSLWFEDAVTILKHLGGDSRRQQFEKLCQLEEMVRALHPNITLRDVIRSVALARSEVDPASGPY
jgi:hypothetical protein